MGCTHVEKDWWQLHVIASIPPTETGIVSIHCPSRTRSTRTKILFYFIFYPPNINLSEKVITAFQVVDFSHILWHPRQGLIRKFRLREVTPNLRRCKPTGGNFRKR